jgi:hypothetical protein
MTPTANAGSGKNQEPSWKEIRAMANEVADELGETDNKPRKQLANIIYRCGVEFVQDVLKETKEVEANGGLLIADGSRRRTTGGVFFYLARERMPEELRRQLFFPWLLAAEQQSAREAQYPAYHWDERLPVLEEIFAQTDRGEVSEVKINLAGRPGHIERRENLVITLMEYEISENLSLPKGLPPLPGDKITYLVYISGNQWERVAETLEKSPKDELIIEGLCTYDPEAQNMAVYATFVTTRKLQRKEKHTKNVSEKASKGGKKQAARAGAGDPPRKAQWSAPQETAPPPPPIDLPANIPPQVARKLTELHTAAASFRQKIAILESKPAGQQFGLEMTQKLLKNTERQIEALQKQYSGEST